MLLISIDDAIPTRRRCQADAVHRVDDFHINVAPASGTDQSKSEIVRQGLLLPGIKCIGPVEEPLETVV